MKARREVKKKKVFIRWYTSSRLEDLWNLRKKITESEIVIISNRSIHLAHSDLKNRARYYFYKNIWVLSFWVTLYIYVYIYHFLIFSKIPGIGLMHWVFGVKTLVESHQIATWCRSKINITTYGSRIKWSNLRNGVMPFPTPQCSSYGTGSLWVAIDNGHWLYFFTLSSKMSLLKINRDT